MRYTLRQLEVFLATAHHQNVTRAASDLAMSQSAASGALRDFENQFDVKLFDRVGKRLRVNELGQSLRPQAEALLAQAQEFEEAIAVGSSPGHLKLGATLSIGNYLAVGTSSGEVELWDVEAYKRTRVMPGHDARVASLAWNQYILSSGGRSGDIVHHDVRVAQHQVARVMGHTQEVTIIFKLLVI